MEILIVIGLLYGFWPVIIGSIVLLDAIFRSVYFWIAFVLFVIWYIFFNYFDNNNNKKNDNSKKE